MLNINFLRAGTVLWTVWLVRRRIVDSVVGQAPYCGQCCWAGAILWTVMLSSSHDTDVHIFLTNSCRTLNNNLLSSKIMTQMYISS